MPIVCKVQKREPEKVLYIDCTGNINQVDLGVFKNFFRGELEDDEPFKVFIDLRKLGDAPLGILKQLAGFMLEVDDIAIDKVLGTAILVSSPSINALVNIVFAFKQPSTPTKITMDLNDACEFLSEV